MPKGGATHPGAHGLTRIEFSNVSALVQLLYPKPYSFENRGRATGPRGTPTLPRVILALTPKPKTLNSKPGHPCPRRNSSRPAAQTQVIASSDLPPFPCSSTAPAAAPATVVHAASSDESGSRWQTIASSSSSSSSRASATALFCRQGSACRAAPAAVGGSKSWRHTASSAANSGMSAL